MAVIKKFNISEVDHESMIAKKFNNGEFLECVKTIRYVLSEADIEIDILTVGIYLIKSYYNLGLYEEAFYEIKLLIALGVCNVELSALAMESMEKLGRLTAHKYFNYTNFDFINDDFDDTESDGAADLSIANSDEDDILYRKQLVSNNIIQELESHKETASSDGFLLVVDKEDTDSRMLNKIYEYLANDQSDMAIDTLKRALEKYPNDLKYLEHILLAYDCAQRHEDVIKTAKKILLLNPNSALAIHAYLEASNKWNLPFDTEYIVKYIKEFKTNNEYDLFLIMQSTVSFCDSIQLTETVQKNNEHLGTSFYNMFVNAYIEYKRDNKDASIKIFKQIRAIFGRRSFADEYIELVKSDKLTILDALEMPKECVLKAIVNIDLVLRDENLCFSDEIANDPVLFDNARVIFYGDEPDVATQILSQLDKNAVVSLMWQLQKLLLDDQCVSMAVKEAILYKLLSTLPGNIVFLSNNDLLEDIDADGFLELVDGDKSLEKAIVLTMSKLYFKEAAMTIRLKSAIQRVYKFKNAMKLSNYKYLAALILVDCWYYGIKYDLDEIVSESNLNKKTLEKYVSGYNSFIGKSPLSEDRDEDTNLTIQGDLDDILGGFSSLIEKIGMYTQDDKPKLRVIKHNNIIIDDEFNDDDDQDN